MRLKGTTDESQTALYLHVSHRSLEKQSTDTIYLTTTPKPTIFAQHFQFAQTYLSLKREHDLRQSTYVAPQFIRRPIRRQKMLGSSRMNDRAAAAKIKSTANTVSILAHLKTPHYAKTCKCPCGNVASPNKGFFPLLKKIRS